MNYIFLPSRHNFIQIKHFEKSDSNLEEYDIVRCTNCGIEGRRHGFDSYIQIPGKVSIKKMIFCTDPSNINYLEKSIKITKCNSLGANFNNLYPNSIHQVIKPPYGQKNGERGIWVMGKYEPVFVFFDEFIFTDEIETEFIRGKKIKEETIFVRAKKYPEIFRGK